MPRKVPPPPPPTTKFQLLDLAMGGRARKFIDDRVAAGQSMTSIAFDVYDETDQRVRVSAVTLADWRRRPWWKHQ